MSFSNAEHLSRQALARGDRILDFGCGRAASLRLLLAEGADAYGADVFFDGMNFADGGPHDLVESGRVRVIRDGLLDFEDDFFDVVVSDQVIEHVEDLDLAVSEMARVLRPGGRMYHQYPALEVIREAHMAVPFSHRLPTAARIRLMSLAARVGLGKHRADDESPRDYAIRSSRWIDDFCVYRPRRIVEEAFRRHGFEVTHAEHEYYEARGAGTRLEPVLKLVPRPVSMASFRALAFDAIDVS